VCSIASQVGVLKKSVVDKLQNLKKWAAPEKAKLSLANDTLSLSPLSSALYHQHEAIQFQSVHRGSLHELVMDLTLTPVVSGMQAHAPLVAFPATALVVPEPLGVVLIFSCWNLPIGENETDRSLLHSIRQRRLR